tara:strand:+ start:282 stop:668 length:387 start_codon:yes stop_codon:yes gene_type:complete
MHAVMSMRNLCQLKDLNPDHILAMHCIKTGDLFLTKENMHARTPVIGFFEYIDGATKLTANHRGMTSYFKPIPIGTVGIYFRRNVISAPQRYGSDYWDKFHEVLIDGKRCVIHEQFIQPVEKGTNNGN